jgi:hypothetical protein
MAAAASALAAIAIAAIDPNLKGLVTIGSFP